jgi:hypothetical protein
MTNAQYKWVIALLVMIGLALACINLGWAHKFGYGAWTPSLILFRIGSGAVYTSSGSCAALSLRYDRIHGL